MFFLSVPANTVVQLPVFPVAACGAWVSLLSVVRHQLSGSLAPNRGNPDLRLEHRPLLPGTVCVVARVPGALRFAVGTAAFSFRRERTSAGVWRFVTFLMFFLFCFSPSIVHLLSLQFSSKDPEG